MTMRKVIALCAALLVGVGAGAEVDMSGCQDLVDNLEAAEAAGQLDAAEHWATLIVEHEEAANPNGALRPIALEHLASLMQDEAHFDEAEQLYLRSISLWKLRPGAPSLELADALNGLGSLYNATGRLASAETLCRRALSIRLERLGPNNVDVAIVYSNLGVVLLRQKQFAQAAALAQQALELWKRLHSPEDRSAVDLNTLALAHLQDLNLETALAYEQEAIRRCKEFPPADHWSLVGYLHTLAVIQWKAGKLSASFGTFDEAIELLQSTRFPNALEKRNLLADYGSVLRKAGQKKKARRMEREAKAESARILRVNPAQRYEINVSSLLAERH